jgi:hypothetical protein
VAQRFTQAFPVGEDALWRALRASLPRVTTQATFWEQARRVHWSTNATAFSWGQSFDSSVEAAGDGSSVLTLTGKSPVRPSFGDRGRREAIFQSLVDGVSETLSRPAAGGGEVPTEDRVRYWNGVEWTVEPPPAPAPAPGG